MRRILMAMALAGLVVACGDDDEDDGDDGTTADGAVRDGAVDSGRMDGGGDGGLDAGMDAAASIMCGTNTCTGHMIANVGFLQPMCTRDFRDAQVCGVVTEILGGVDAGYPAVLQKDAPGPLSTSCGSFFDSQETGDAGVGNGRIDTTVFVRALNMTVAISYPGCCTERGFCSVQTSMGMTVAGPSNAGLGCLESTVAFRAQPAAAQMIPCNPTTGVLALDGGT